MTRDGHTSAEAVIVLHRYPQVVAISPLLAERLLAAGVPRRVVGAPPEAVA